LLESLDPQSSYLTPREYAEYKQKTGRHAAGETGLTMSKRSATSLRFQSCRIVLQKSRHSQRRLSGIRRGIHDAGDVGRQALNLLRGLPGTA